MQLSSQNSESQFFLGRVTYNTIPYNIYLTRVTHNLVPRSHSVTGNVRSDKVRQYTIFHWLLKKRLQQRNLRSDWLISRGT